MKITHILVLLVLVYMNGCAGMMPPTYMSTDNGPTASVRFSGTTGAANPIAIVEYGIYKCKILTWDNMYGYVSSVHTVNVPADEPLLIKVELGGVDHIFNIVYSGVNAFSFHPKAGENYIVGIHFDDSERYSVYAHLVDSHSGEQQKVFIEKGHMTGMGIRFSPHIVTNWPECK